MYLDETIAHIPDECDEIEIFDANDLAGCEVAAPQNWKTLSRGNSALPLPKSRKTNNSTAIYQSLATKEKQKAQIQ